MYSRPSRHRDGQAPWYSWGLQILVGAKMPSEWSSWHLTLRWNDKSLWPDTWCWHQPLISLQPVNQWSCSVVSDSAIPWIVAYQAPPSMEFSRQEYQSRLPLSSPGDLPQARDWTQVFSIAGRCFTVWATREALPFNYHLLIRAHNVFSDKEPITMLTVTTYYESSFVRVLDILYLI